MNKIKFVLTPGTLDKMQGKYTAIPISNGTLKGESLCESVSEGRPAIDSADAQLALSALVSEVTRLVGQGYTCSLPFGTIGPGITGSLPAMDSPLGEDNAIVAQFSVNPVYHKQITSIVPSRDKEADIVKIESIEDVATHQKGVIVGTNPFVITGWGLSMTQDGEALNLMSEDGSSTLDTATYIAEGSQPPMFIRARLAVNNPAADYKLRLKSRGYGRPTHALDEFMVKVKCGAAS